MDTKETLLKILDGMADFENRISYLEMSTPTLPSSKEQPEEKPPARNLSRKEWDELQQVKARLAHLEKKVLELRAKKEARY